MCRGCVCMCVTKGLCSAACVKEQPNWPVKGTYSLSPLSLCLLPPQSNGCHSELLTAVSAGQQSICRFKLPLPLSKCPLNLIPICLFLFLSPSSSFSVSCLFSSFPPAPALTPFTFFSPPRCSSLSCSVSWRSLRFRLITKLFLVFLSCLSFSLSFPLLPVYSHISL